MTTTLEHVQTFKILIIGDSSVGKSSLMTRFVHGIFNTQYIATIGVDFQIAIVNTGDYKCRLQIWDTAGQERFRSITSTYFRGADGIMIVYDVTNQASFDHIKVRISELQHYCDETVPRILIGNKDDNNNKMDKVVLTRDAREYAEKNNLPLFEISVRDNKNITEAFNELTRVVLKRRLEQPEITPNNVMGRRLDQPIDNDARKQCCPM